MRHFLTATALTVLCAACSQADDDGTIGSTAPEMAEAVATDAGTPPTAETAMAEEDGRPVEDRNLDASRHPAEVLAFAGVQPGWRVADLTAGTGYYTRILSTAVGPTGHVIAHNPDWVAERFPDTDQALAALADSRDNVTHVVSPIAEFADGLDAPLDAVFMVLFYHDTAWDGTDRAAMNSAIYDALAPGGVYLVIDHHAASGTGLDHVEDLHRIDAETVRSEVTAAGFELAAESDLLANAEDGRESNVFDPSIRRQTDRFVMRFVKPN